jgi:antitoxin ParD1/3/4
MTRQANMRAIESLTKDFAKIEVRLTPGEISMISLVGDSLSVENRSTAEILSLYLNRSGVKSVNIQLKSEREQFIRSQIDRGEYQTAEDVISEAFKLLEARTNKIEELRQKVAVGTQEIANGQMTDGEVVFERLQAKIDRIAKNNNL